MSNFSVQTTIPWLNQGSHHVQEKYEDTHFGADKSPVVPESYHARPI